MTKQIPISIFTDPHHLSSRRFSSFMGPLLVQASNSLMISRARAYATLKHLKHPVSCATPNSHRPVQKLSGTDRQSEIVAATNGPIGPIFLWPKGEKVQ